MTSVGIGGTNVHVVLEEAPAQNAAPRSPAASGHEGEAWQSLRSPAASRHDDEAWQVLPISARTEEQLALAADCLAALLESPDSPALADVALTLRVGRAELDVRRCVLARADAEAAAALRALTTDRNPADAATLAPDPLHRLAGAADLEQAFFGAGGDSLAAIHLVDRLEQEYGLEVPLELLLDRLSLRELVEASCAPADPSAGDADLLGALLDEIESAP